MIGDAVSAKHVVVTCEVKDAECWPPALDVKIIDVSRNGCVLNGEKMRKDEYYALKDGDMVTLPFHMDYRFELNPEGTLPRATRSAIEETATPLQKKRSSPAVAAARDEVAKRSRESDVGESAVAPAAPNASFEVAENARLRRLVEELERKIEEMEKQRLQEKPGASEPEAVAPPEDEEAKKALEQAMNERDVAVAKLAEVETRAREAEAELDARASKAEAELEEARKVVEGAAAATKELETKLEEADEALQVAETKRVEEFNALEKQHAEQLAVFQARIDGVDAMEKRHAEEVRALRATLEKLESEQEPLRRELELAQSRLAKNEEAMANSRDLAQKLVEILGHELPEKTRQIAANDEEAPRDEDELPEPMEKTNDDSQPDGEDERKAMEDDDAETDGFNGFDNYADRGLSDSVLADVEFPPTEPQPAPAVDDEDDQGDDDADPREPSPLRSIGNSPRQEPSPKCAGFRNSEEVIPMNVLDG